MEQGGFLSPSLLSALRRPAFRRCWLGCSPPSIPFCAPSSPFLWSDSTLPVSCFPSLSDIDAIFLINVELGHSINPSSKVIKDLGEVWKDLIFFLSLLKSLLRVQQGPMFNGEFESQVIWSAMHFIWQHPAWIRSWDTCCISWQPNGLFCGRSLGKMG